MSLRTVRSLGVYVIGEGSTASVFDDAMFLAEQGDIEGCRCAIRALFYRHADLLRTLGRVTGTQPDELPFPTSLGTPRTLDGQPDLGIAAREMFA